MPDLSLPCARCQTRSGYRFPEERPRYGYRCPGCGTVLHAEAFYVHSAQSRGMSGLPGMSLGSWIQAGILTFAWFELKVRRHDGSGGARVIDFFTANPLADLNYFRTNDSVIFVFQGESLVAVVNATRDGWVTTRTGGLDRLRSFLPLGK